MPSLSPNFPLQGTRANQAHRPIASQKAISLRSENPPPQNQFLHGARNGLLHRLLMAPTVVPPTRLVLRHLPQHLVFPVQKTLLRRSSLNMSGSPKFNWPLPMAISVLFVKR